MSGLTLELYVRSLAPVGGEPSRSETIEQLRVLAEHGAVDGYEILVWGRAMPTDSDHPLAQRLDRFRAWAADHGATLVGVEERPAGAVGDEPRRVTRLPTAVLAEYHDGDLAVVTPREHDGSVRTVADHLGALTLDPAAWFERGLAASD